MKRNPTQTEKEEYEKFRNSLSETYIPGVSRFIVIEPDVPVKFGNTQEQCDDIYDGELGKDPSLMFPDNTVFIRVSDGWTFHIVPLNKQTSNASYYIWEEYSSLKDVPENVKAIALLLGITLDIYP